MKTSFTPQEIKITFCTVTGSLLLCSSMEVRAASAEDEPTPWYNQALPSLTLPTDSATYPGRLRFNPDLQSSRLTVEDASPSAWDHVYGKTSRQAQTDSLAQGSSIPGASEFKGPALLTVQSNSGHTQRVGLILSLIHI